MEKTEQIKEEPKSRVRFDRLREIEKDIQAAWDEKPEEYLYAKAPEDYSGKTLEEKNAEKYMVSFPYPYMNGYLHLGHAFSATKAEYAARYQRQRGKNVLFAQGFHCTGMPIQAAANRLKAEITSGKTTSEEPPKPKEEPGAKKGKGKDKKVEAPRRKYTQYEILQQLGIPDD